MELFDGNEEEGSINNDGADKESGEEDLDAGEGMEGPSEETEGDSEEGDVGDGMGELLGDV